MTALSGLLRARRSVRAFLPTPVPRATVEALLAEAARAPSGANMQPWRVHVLQGAALQRVVQGAQAIHADPAARAELRAEYLYYPEHWQPPYEARRRELGLNLYRLLGIAKGDKAGMHAQHGRNYSFFGAPVGLLFSVHRCLTQGAWLDLGMFMQNLMLAARAKGLDTCAQAAWIHYQAELSEWLDLPQDEMLVCGMALGHADPEAVENQLHSRRAEVAEFATFHDD
ncbi:nitroreductase [Inhella inkyongensis]|uniref:Nitroreductase n=1 Tax=Inhella inkyongensis TaxID=392593 RepID=A0A840S2F0_9BURK|nr:nitroreductase [Inhella inkyongensis]MBB5203588.1 nitroreductase [Inhella inkyongensis]